MTLEQQLSDLLAKHDLLSVDISAMAIDGEALIQSSVQCMVSGKRECFTNHARGGNASALLAQSIAQANAARYVPAEVEQLASIAA